MTTVVLPSYRGKADINRGYINYKHSPLLNIKKKQVKATMKQHNINIP